jgi:hypothetical protein
LLWFCEVGGLILLPVNHPDESLLRMSDFVAIPYEEMNRGCDTGSGTRYIVLL